MTQPSEPGIKSEYGEGDMEACDTNTTCLLVRRSARSRAAVTVLTLLFSVVFLLVATRVSNGSDLNIISGMHGGNLATIISELPPDPPVGTKATVALLSFKRALHLHEPCLSTFIVDYPGRLGGSASIADRGIRPGSRAVGEIRAQAWEAGMGTYRSGQTWVEPAVVNDIITKNASAVEPALALVVLMTSETSSSKSEDH